MRLLVDNCLSPRLVAELRGLGHDVSAVCEWDRDPGDSAILARAFSESRVLITLDDDFCELAVVGGRPHAGILRVDEQDFVWYSGIIRQMLDVHGDDLQSGAMIIAEREFVRIRLDDN